MQKLFTLRSFLFVCLASLFGTGLMAQSNTISNGGTYSQNFNGMTITATATLPDGWKADENTVPRTVGIYSAAQNHTDFIAGANMANPLTGGVYNFGAGTTADGNSDRALGGLNTSSNPTSVNVYFALQNTGGTPISDFVVSYSIEKYRNGKNNNGSAVQLYYSTDGTTWFMASTATLYVADADNNGFSPAPDASQTRFVVNAGVSPTGGIAAGATLYLAWNISTPVSTPGADASNSMALGIDDVTIKTGTGGFLPGLYFRSHQTGGGNWNDPATWESSSNNSTWDYPQSFTPTYTDYTITVRSPDVVTVTAPVMTDQTTIDAGATLIVNGGVVLSINDGVGFDLTVNGTVSGTGNLLIKSVSTGTDAGTASIGPSNGFITVPTTVERLISAVYNRSAWRFLTAPLTSTGSIFDTWQNGGVYAPGIGTTVTGPTYTATGGTPGSPVSDANGLDYNTAAPSLYTFDAATQNIVAVTNTKTTLLGGATNIGYYIFINGDRHAFFGTPNQTTLSATGTLQTGLQSFTTSATANGITLIGNPYASAVDLNTFNTDNFSASNVKPSYYYWDPYLTGTYGVGGYVTVSYASAGGTATIAPLSACATTCGDETQYLQSGQAMFVVTNSSGGAGAVTFNENQKDATSVNNIFRVQSANIDNIRVNLNVINAGTPVLVDGIAASFNNSYSPKVDNYDATKFYNPGESIAFMRDNKALSIERMPLSSDAVLYLNLYKLKENITYQLEINPTINANGLKAYLVDNYLKTNTEIDLGKTTTVNFTINSEAASTGSNRFSISFSKPGVVVAGKAAMSVFPNPVTNGVINLQMSNMPQGIYNVRVFNSMGQVIATKQINHSAGTVTETLQVKGLSKGIYQLEVVKPDNSKFSSKLMTN